MKHIDELPDDDFQRQDVAIKLAELLASDIDVSPLLLNGNWGSGKTTLVRRLENQLIERRDNIEHIYINAFQEDHCENSLITLIAAIARAVPNDEDPKLFEKAIPVIKYGLKIGSKAAIGWLLRKNFDDCAEEIEQAIKESTNKAVDYSIDSMLKDHRDSEQNIAALKGTLEDLSKEKKFVIIIDELDRCKPSFAIDIIENIKYIFDMDNIRFLLVANSNHLESSICHKYGDSGTSKGYLDKFVKYTLDIPSSFGQPWSLKNSSAEFFLKELERNEIIDIYQTKEVLNDIAELIKINNISLREVQTLVRTIRIYNQFAAEKISVKTHYLIISAKLIAIFIYCFGYKFGLSLEKLRLNTLLIEETPGLQCSKDNYLGTPASCISILLAYCDFNKMKSSYELKENILDFKYPIQQVVDDISQQFGYYFRGNPNISETIYGVHLTLSLK